MRSAGRSSRGLLSQPCCCRKGSAASLVANAPPRPPFGLTIGVTGHRAEALGGDEAAIRSRIAHLLDRLRSLALDVLDADRSLFADEAPSFTLVSPLASGADQLAAAVALEAGWSLQVVLPLPQDDYAQSMTSAEAAELARLAGSTQCLLELPGRAEELEEAYVMAGRATVAHCDLLLAVWDGLPARGRGGTAETIDLALVRGTPVLHLPIATDQPAALLWSVFDPLVVTQPGDRHCGRPADPENIGKVLRARLAPPADPRERRFIQ